MPGFGVARNVRRLRKNVVSFQMEHGFSHDRQKEQMFTEHFVVPIILRQRERRRAGMLHEEHRIARHSSEPGHGAFQELRQVGAEA